MTWPLFHFVKLPPAPTVARNALGSKMDFGVVRHHIRQAGVARLVTAPFAVSYIFLPFVSYFAQTSYVMFLSLRFAQETPPPRGLKWNSGDSRFVPTRLRAARRLVQKSSPRGPGVAKIKIGTLDMRISQDQAIEIHARVLKYWHRDRAPQEARARALDCATAGDFDSFQAWARVARLCEALRAVDRSRAMRDASGPISAAWRPPFKSA